LINIKNITKLEGLECIEHYKSESSGLGIKKSIYRIKNSDYFINIEYWKGDNFYSYDTDYIKFIGIDSLKYPNDMHKYDSLPIQDCIKLLPENAQIEILMNLDLFMST